MDNAIQTTHDLDFKHRPWKPSESLLGKLLDVPDSSEYMEFRVGTCVGLWTVREGNYVILSILNQQKGNGHFEDVLEWFYNSCLRDKKGLIFEELMNDDFRRHLIEKRGFAEIDKDTLGKGLSAIQNEHYNN